MKPLYEIGDILRDTKVDILYLVEGIDHQNYHLLRLNEDARIFAGIKTLAYDHYITKVA
jgi:hypothetical protein